MKRVTSASLLLSLVTGTLVLVLVTVFALSALDAWRREQATSRVLSSARISRDIVLVREAVRVELGLIDTAIADPAPITQEHLEQLKGKHRQTIAALHFVDSEMARSGNDKISAVLAKGLHAQVVAFDTRLFPIVLAAAQGPKSRRSRSLIFDPT